MSEGFDPRWNGPIHLWFELTYASYLVLPRLVLQSMPVDWQERFVACLEQVRETFPDISDKSPEYAVFVRNERGRLQVEDSSIRDYRHNMLDLPDPAQ